MATEPLTDDRLSRFLRKVSSLVITAELLPDLYRKLNTLRKNSASHRRLLRSPVRRDGFLIAVVVKYEEGDPNG